MIGKIDHVGIAVRSIAEARGLYEALGLHVEAIEDVPHEGVRVALIPAASRTSSCWSPSRRIRPSPSSWRSAGRASTISAWRATTCGPTTPGCARRGFQVLRPEPTRGAGGCWVQFVHPKSTGGVLLELSEGEHGA